MNSFKKDKIKSFRIYKQPFFMSDPSDDSDIVQRKNKVFTAEARLIM